jgi:uncharacterized protein YukE
MIIKVEINVMRQECQHCQTQRQQLQRIMQAIFSAMQILATVAWISPASKALWAKFQLLYKQIEEALRIVDDYISKLEFAMQQYRETDERATSRIDGLKTDIFGI